ncbi:hypothetical protein V5F53_02680 [Xanthobacter sp. V4C-4]|uniref:hypothetical protein n=1 Tax=Xanthobacter cornucopiae TaxID=3119924 RepID=UPI00372CB581
MKEYEQDIYINGYGKGRLKVIRLPNSWFAVIWKDPENYLSLSQDRTENKIFEHHSDKYFLGHVRMVAGITQGIDFDLI